MKNWGQTLFTKHALLLVLFFVVFASAMQAQSLWEIGLRGGTSFYLGDKNAVVFDRIQPVGAFYIRKNYNPRYSALLQLEGTHFTGIFEKNLVDGTAQLEFNFFEYGLMNSSQWTRWFSPYIFGGYSFAVFRADKNDLKMTSNFPFGLGVKCKVFRIVNVNLEWSMHKLFTDKLDYIDNPYGINASKYNNNDWYSFATLSLGIDLGKKKGYCNVNYNEFAKRKNK